MVEWTFYYKPNISHTQYIILQILFLLYIFAVYLIVNMLPKEAQVIGLIQNLSLRPFMWIKTETKRENITTLE